MNKEKKRNERTKDPRKFYIIWQKSTTTARGVFFNLTLNCYALTFSFVLGLRFCFLWISFYIDGLHEVWSLSHLICFFKKDHSVVFCVQFCFICILSFIDWLVHFIPLLLVLIWLYLSLFGFCYWLIGCSPLMGISIVMDPLT